MTAILLALGSSVGYGVSDFLASRVARRVPPVLLVLYSQALQSVVLLAVVVAVRQPYSAGGLAWGTASGAIGAAGLVAYYQALATGQTAIVAPLASSGAVLPVLVDLARGERPGPLALAGALRSRGRRLGIDDPALLAPVALLTVLNLSADAFLAYAVTRGDLAVVSVLASLAPVVTAVCPRPHRRAPPRPRARRGRPGRARHPGRVRRPGGHLAVQSSVRTGSGGTR